MKNKVLTFLLSLAISFGLWLYVVTVISPEWESTYYNVPVELVGTDYLDAKNLLIVSDTNLSMDLTLRGSRTDLNKLTSSNITILADLSKISSAGEHQLKYTIAYPGSIQVEVVNQEPQGFSVTVAEQLSKTVAVEVYYAGNVVSGYEVDKTNVSMDHTTVTVRGPKDVVEKIDHAGITVDLTGKMSTFVWDYPLILYTAESRPVVGDKNLVTNVEEVRTIIQVNRVKKVPLTFDIDDRNSGLLAEMVTVYPSVQEITVMGSDAALEKLTEVKLGTIMLSDLASSAMLSFRLELPAGVVCKDAIDVVSVEVTVPEMASMVFHVNRFDYRNVSQGLQVEVTGIPVVEVWGPKEILDALTYKEILGVVDCTGITWGNTYAPISYTVEGHEYLSIHADLSVIAIRVRNAQENTK